MSNRSLDELRKENEVLRRQLEQYKQADEALRKSEERYRLLADNVNDIIWTMDMNFRYTYLSPSFERHSGYSLEEAMTLTLEDSFTPASVEAIHKAFLEEIAPERIREQDRFKSRALELEAYNKDNSTFWVEVLARIQCDAEGQPIGILGITRNISERKRAERKVQEALENETEARHKLEEEIQKRVEFTRALVHELKTPLTSMIASSDLLASELPKGLLLRMAKNVNRSANDLDKRIDELLDVARGELGMLKLHLTLVDPLRMLQELAEDMGPATLSRHQSLILDMPLILPPIWADEDRLRQIVLNLLNNAYKFTGEGGNITLKAREESDSLIVEVEDTGPGVSEVEQQRLFTAYYRGEGDKEHHDGLGLGLALCKMLVELHKGQIWVRSQPAKGSTFGFSIPLATASRRENAAKAQEK